MVELLRLSERTRFVLASFAKVNPSIVIRPGSTIRTADSGMAKVAATAAVDQVFDREIGIFSIPRFLAMMARFEDPVLVFGTKPNVMAIRDGSGHGAVLRHPLARPGATPIPPDQEPRFEVDTAFDLPGVELAWTLAAAKVLSLGDLVVVGAGGRIELLAQTPCQKNGDPHRTCTVIGETDLELKVVLSAANVRKLMLADYRVEVGYRGRGSAMEGVAKFTAADAGLTYWMAVEDGSEPSNLELRAATRAAILEQQQRAAEYDNRRRAEQKAKKDALKIATAEDRSKLKAAVAKLPEPLRGRIRKVSHRLDAFRTRSRSTITITDHDAATVEAIRAALVAGGIAPEFAKAIFFRG